MSSLFGSGLDEIDTLPSSFNGHHLGTNHSHAAMRIQQQQNTEAAIGGPNTTEDDTVALMGGQLPEAESESENIFHV